MPNWPWVPPLLPDQANPRCPAPVAWRHLCVFLSIFPHRPALKGSPTVAHSTLTWACSAGSHLPLVHQLSPGAGVIGSCMSPGGAHMHPWIQVPSQHLWSIPSLSQSKCHSGAGQGKERHRGRSFLRTELELPVWPGVDLPLKTVGEQRPQLEQGLPCPPTCSPALQGPGSPALGTQAPGPTHGAVSRGVLISKPSRAFGGPPSRLHSLLLPLLNSLEGPLWEPKPGFPQGTWHSCPILSPPPLLPTLGPNPREFWAQTGLRHPGIPLRATVAAAPWTHTSPKRK